MVYCFLYRDYSLVEKGNNVSLRMPLGMRTNSIPNEWGVKNQYSWLNFFRSFFIFLSPVRDVILVENSSHLSPLSPVRDVICEKIFRPVRDLGFGWIFSTNIQSLTGQKRTNIFYKFL